LKVWSDGTAEVQSLATGRITSVLSFKKHKPLFLTKADMELGIVITPEPELEPPPRIKRVKDQES
jgi:hypothetical protein